jgi:hypothetical protein
MHVIVGLHSNYIGSSTVIRLLWLELVISPDSSESRFCAETYFRLLSAFISCHSRAIQPGTGCWMTSCTIIMRIRILGEYSRILETWFDSNSNSLWRTRISMLEFEFEFGEFSRHFQNSNSPNIRKFEYEFELGEFFPTPGHKEIHKSANRRSHTIGFGKLAKFKSGVTVSRCAYSYRQRTVRQF